MANADAFNSGFDAGQGKKSKSGKTGKNETSGSKNAMPNGAAVPGEFKHGGKVKKTGLAKVHKGEIVLTAAQAKAKLGKKRSKKSSRKKVSKR